ncbi:ribosome 60S biogenesis N-terminal-domain-containing protein [Powellomyces hirtus]|nr:ribosome 60S biogenesis N-terminal-domain-containing protein [Powellomyces hirtus]
MVAAAVTTPAAGSSKKKDAAQDDNSKKEHVTVPATAPSCLTHRALLDALNSDNVETLHAGLTSFNRSLARLVYGDVDHEISPEADLLKAYLKGSPEGAELFRIWTLQQTNQLERIAAVIPDVIARIITGAKLVQLFPIGSTIARTVIRDHMVAVYRNLSSGKHITIQSTLRLLVAVAGLRSSTAKELHDIFNFGLKALTKILNTRQKKSGEETKSSRRTEDIRSLYVKFLLCFLEQGDALVKKVMLETKDLLSSIFKGLADDTYQTVDYVLSTFRRYVVDDANMKRTAKIAFFNNYILEQLTRLYTKTDVLETPHAADRGLSIADLVHAFLIHTCTNPGIGICFQDAGWYPAKAKTGAKTIRVYNTVLLKLLLSLKPIDDERQLKLLLEGLSKCPELTQPYWKELGSLSFDPRVSTKWFANMALVAKIIQLPVPQYLGASEIGLPPPPVEIVADNILPPPLDRSVCSRALQHSNSLVKHTASVVLALAFDKLTKVQDTIKDMIFDISRLSMQTAAIVGNMDGLIRKWNVFGTELIEEIRRRVPDLQIVLALQHQQLRQAVETKEQNGDPMDTDEPVVQTEEVSAEMLHCAALQVIRHYQRQFPDAVLESRVNYGKFLPPDLTVLSTELQLHLLDLISEVPEFNWKERSANAAGSHLRSFLHLYMTTQAPDILRACNRVLHRTLSDSFLFQHHIDEIPSWLDILKSVSTHGHDPVLAWLDEALCTGARTPYRTVDKLSELINQTHEKMNDRAKRVAAHVLESRRNAIMGDAITHFADVPFFPFSPALMCAADGLHAVMKRGDAKEAARCFFKLVFRIYHATQGVSEYLTALVQQTGHGKTTEAGAWDAEQYLLTAAMYLRSKGTEVDAMEVDKLSSSIENVQSSWKKVLKHLDNEEADERIFLNFLLTTPPDALPHIFSDVVSNCIERPKYRAAFVDELHIRHPALGSLFTTYAIYDSTAPDSVAKDAASMLLSHLDSANLVANVMYAPSTTATHYQASIQSRIEQCNDPRMWIELARQLLLHMSTATSTRKSELLELCVPLLRTLLGQARTESAKHEMDGAVLPEAGYLPRAAVYDVLRDTVFGHPFLLDTFVSDKPENAEMRKQVLSLVHQIMTTEAADRKRCTTKYLLLDQSTSTWDRYTDLIRDKLLAEITSHSTQIHADTLAAFTLLRQHMPSQSLDTILKPLLTIGAKDTNRVLFLGLTAKTAGNEQVIPAEFAKRLLVLMRTERSAEVEKIVLKIVRDAVVPCSQTEGMPAAATFRVTAGSESSSTSFSEVPALFDTKTLSYLVDRTSDGDESTTCAETLRHLITTSPQIRDWVAKRIADKKNLVQLFTQSSAEILFGALLFAFTFRDNAKTKEGMDSVTWIPGVDATIQNMIKALHERLAIAIRASIMDGVVGSTSPFAVPFAADTLFRTAVLFGPTHYGGPQFLETVLAKTVELRKPVNASAACDWLKDHLVVLRSFADGAPDGSDHVVLLCLWIIRAVFQNKKKVTVAALDTVEERHLQSVVALVESTIKFGHNTDGENTIRVLQKNVESINSFIVATMKFRLADPAALRLLHATIVTIYDPKRIKDASNGLPFPLEVLCERIMSHSQFNSIVNAIPGKEEPLTPSSSVHRTSLATASRTRLLQLLHTLMSLDPMRCCKTEHLTTLAQSYRGTTSPSDCAIMGIFSLYETTAGISVEAYARLWNQMGGDEEFATRVSVADSLAKIDPVWMAHTCQGFGVDAGISADSAAATTMRVFSSRLSPLYDPAFFLPLIASSLIVPDSHTQPAISARTLLESNSLGLAVLALSSNSDATRRAGYFILDLAYPYIIASAEQLKERNQILLALDGLKNAIGERKDAMISKFATTQGRGDTQRIPSIMALFIAQALMVAIKPEHEMYPLINRFFLQRPVVDMEDIPMFYELFYSASDNCRKERVWMLRLLTCGLKSAADYRLYKRRHVVDILLSFYPSPLADTQTRKLVLEFLLRATTLPSVLSDMITQSGLLVFLTTLCGTLDFAPPPPSAYHAGAGAVHPDAVGVIKLVRAVLRGFEKTPVEWHGARRGMWFDNIATCVSAVVQNVVKAAKDAGAVGNSSGSNPKRMDPDAVPWWTTLVCETIYCVNDLIRHAVNDTTTTSVTPIAMGHLADLVIVWEACWECLMPTTTTAGAVGEEHEDADYEEEKEEGEDMKWDLDTLYAVPTTPRTLTKILEKSREMLYGVICGTPASAAVTGPTLSSTPPQSASSTIETLMGFLLTALETRTHQAHAQSRITPLAFLTFLGRILQPSPTSTTTTITNVIAASTLDRARRVLFRGPATGSRLAERIRKGVCKVLEQREGREREDSERERKRVRVE